MDTRHRTLVLIGIATALIGAQSINHGVITGKVTDVSGMGVPFVDIRVQGGEYGARTGSDGLFTITDVPTGIHLVRATSMGYIRNEQPGVVVNTGKTTTLNFTMRLRGGLDEPVRVRHYALPPDSALQVTISMKSGSKVHLRKNRWPLPEVDARLRNAGPDTIVLVEPGEVHRTPIIRWDVRTRDGYRTPPEIVGYCGNRSPLQTRDILTLAPGEEHTLRFSFPGLFRYQKDTYVVRLVYENDPSLLGGTPLGEDDAEAVRALRGSTPCKVMSNQLVVEVRP